TQIRPKLAHPSAPAWIGVHRIGLDTRLHTSVFTRTAIKQLRARATKIWTAVASVARHRFGFLLHEPEPSRASSILPRRSQGAVAAGALPAHSKVVAAPLGVLIRG